MPRVPVSDDTRRTRQILTPRTKIDLTTPKSGVLSGDFGTNIVENVLDIRKKLQGLQVAAAKAELAKEKQELTIENMLKTHDRQERFAKEKHDIALAKLNAQKEGYERKLQAQISEIEFRSDIRERKFLGGEQRANAMANIKQKYAEAMNEIKKQQALDRGERAAETHLKKLENLTRETDAEIKNIELEGKLDIASFEFKSELARKNFAREADQDIEKHELDLESKRVGLEIKQQKAQFDKELKQLEAAREADQDIEKHEIEISKLHAKFEATLDKLERTAEQDVAKLQLNLLKTDINTDLAIQRHQFQSDTKKIKFEQVLHKYQTQIDKADADAKEKQQKLRAYLDEAEVKIFIEEEKLKGVEFKNEQVRIKAEEAANAKLNQHIIDDRVYKTKLQLDDKVRELEGKQGLEALNGRYEYQIFMGEAIPKLTEGLTEDQQFSYAKALRAHVHGNINTLSVHAIAEEERERLNTQSAIIDQSVDNLSKLTSTATEDDLEDLRSRIVEFNKESGKSYEDGVKLWKVKHEAIYTARVDGFADNGQFDKARQVLNEQLLDVVDPIQRESTKQTKLGQINNKEGKSIANDLEKLYDTHAEALEVAKLDHPDLLEPIAKQLGLLFKEEALENNKPNNKLIGTILDKYSQNSSYDHNTEPNIEDQLPETTLSHLTKLGNNLTSWFGTNKKNYAKFVSQLDYNKLRGMDRHKFLPYLSGLRGEDIRTGIKFYNDARNLSQKEYDDKNVVYKTFVSEYSDSPSVIYGGNLTVDAGKAYRIAQEQVDYEIRHKGSVTAEFVKKQVAKAIASKVGKFKGQENPKKDY